MMAQKIGKCLRRLAGSTRRLAPVLVSGAVTANRHSHGDCQRPACIMLLGHHWADVPQHCKSKTGHRVPAAQPRPTASSPLFSQIASRWFDILPWQPEEANLDLARAIPPPPRARHCTCPPARPSAILEEPPGFRRQDLRRDASEQPRWLISDASEHPRAEPTRLRDFV